MARPLRSAAGRVWRLRRRTRKVGSAGEARPARHPGARDAATCQDHTLRNTFTSTASAVHTSAGDETCADAVAAAFSRLPARARPAVFHGQ